MAFASNPISLANLRLVRGLISIKRSPVWEQLPNGVDQRSIQNRQALYIVTSADGKEGKKGKHISTDGKRFFRMLNMDNLSRRLCAYVYDSNVRMSSRTVRSLRIGLFGDDLKPVL